MVRAHMKHAVDAEREISEKKKSAASKKKSTEPGNWPCKINGCDKVFAREADLKRHQRTTKTHTMPGFACPQCDANFTRTDALRRHQKSRHNGVILEPSEAPRPLPATNGNASESRSSSRSGTPTDSNAEQDSATDSPEALKSRTQYTSYYRPHTLQSTLHYPRPPPSMDHYPPSVAIPTSAARLNQPIWQPPPSAWPEGAPPPPMYPPPYYHPSPYYRPPMYPMHPPPGYPPVPPEYMTQQYPYAAGPPVHFPGPMQPPLSAIPRGGSSSPTKDNEGQTNTNGEAPSKSSSSGRKRKRSRSSSATEDATESDGQPGSKRNSFAAVSLDPSLMLDADEAATVVALLQQASGQSISPDLIRISDVGSRNSSDLPPRETIAPSETTVSTVHVPPPLDPGKQGMDADADVNADVDTDGDEDADAEGEEDEDVDGEVENVVEILSNTEPPQPPPPLGHILTEDGEPMLNPAELLTQESLASPPQV
ncbi:hypothetical protein BXZ70DRAFT_947150 [Cristinia sonorae]|uniref:C2H2-type domain-containing protein n=1 Tax=Cristinia sonorae TaxID=1940300 RepID=A0A8K0XMY2_9AGAR|nr:hypothetical protein BXZ70DRAFT_947150 [Cristinia sonorae]